MRRREAVYRELDAEDRSARKEKSRPASFMDVVKAVGVTEEDAEN